jgi:hypothetical protein
MDRLKDVSIIKALQEKYYRHSPHPGFASQPSSSRGREHLKRSIRRFSFLREPKAGARGFPNLFLNGYFATGTVGIGRLSADAL